MATLTAYRAQIKSDDGKRWIDGNLYQCPEQAQQDAAEMHAKYGNQVRVADGA